MLDVIEYEPYVQKALQYACSNTVVCETELEAKRICFDEKAASTAVTLDGSNCCPFPMILSSCIHRRHGDQAVW